MVPNAKFVGVAVAAGFLTPLGLIGVSWLTAENFLAEGADTTLSRIPMIPLERSATLANHVFGISGWALFFATAAALILVFSSFYYLFIRWALVPLMQSRPRLFEL
jgi:hypothetical protein